MRAIAIVALAGAPCTAFAQCYELEQTLGDPTGELANFGARVAIDGDRVLASAPTDDTAGPNVGRAYLFDFHTGALLRAFDDPTPTVEDFFGAVAMDGDLIIIGDSLDDTQGPNVGQAHLFDASTGDLLMTLDDPSPTGSGMFQGDGFGGAVATSGDRVLVSASRDDTRGVDVGQAHLFDAGSGDLLVTFDDPTPTTADRFGAPTSGSVAIEGDFVLIGAPGDDSHGENVGQAYLFDAATGDLLHIVDDPTPEASGHFATHVDIEGDLLAIGDSGEAGAFEAVGQAHLFDAASGDLLQTFDDPTPTGNDVFGRALSLDAGRILIGAPGDDMSGADYGQVHLFDIGTSELLQTLENPTPVEGDDFGNDLVLRGGRIVIGAERVLNDFADEPGAVHFFAIPGDFDGSGVLDFFDFLAFQSAFGAGDLAADCDGDMTLSFFDFLCFQNEFASGCG